MEGITIKKFGTAILIVSSLLLITFILLRYFFPSFHSETHRGIEYYKTESYTDFGIGFNRYGKIASEYLPKYSDVSENSKYIDFYYNDSSFGIHKYVVIAMGSRYDSDVYKSKRDEILNSGTPFGQDTILNNNESRHYRLIEAKTRINGERVYYIVGCSDMDCTIMYYVYIDNQDYVNEMFWIFDDTGIIYTAFWQELHPITASNAELIPKIY